MILKSDYISVEDSIIMEEKILQEYIKNGWNTINKAKTGGIGGNSKWDKEICEFEIQKYETLKEFKEKCSGAYFFIQKNKWQKELFTKYFKEYKFYPRN